MLYALTFAKDHPFRRPRPRKENRRRLGMAFCLRLVPFVALHVASMDEDRRGGL